MRVGMLVNNLSVSGGYQKLVLRLSAELVRRGHEVVIYSRDVDRERCYPGEWPDVEVVSPVGGGAAEERWDHLARAIDAELDAIIVHDEPSFAAMRAFRRRATRIPRVVWMLNNELGSLRRAVALRALLQAAVTAAVRRQPARLLVAVRVERSRRALRSEALRCDAFAVYDARNAALVRRFLRRPATVVLAGADVEAFERIERKPSGNAFSILSVGVLYPHRRYEDLIAAGRRVDFPVELTIVGLHSLAPDYAESIRTAAEASAGPLFRIRLVEYAPVEQLDAIYAATDAFAFVNDGHTWGIAVFEAVAAGVPVVITDNIGAADLIRDGVSGFVVPPRDPEALAAALERIRSDPEWSDAVACRARETILPLVRWSAYAERMEMLLQTA